MNDPREELDPYWPQTALPFGMTPQPTGSLPGLGWGALPVNQALLSMWDSSKTPIRPAQAPWFPPAPQSANQPTPVAEPLDSFNYRGAAPAPTVASVPPPIPSEGILGDFGQERRGILGNFGQRGDHELRTDPWAIRLPFRAPSASIPIESLAKRGGIAALRGSIGETSGDDPRGRRQQNDERSQELQSMTAKIADIMILDGEAFELHTTPLEGYFERIKWRPACRVSTANRRGYVARWELFGERLFLTGLFGMNWVVPEHLVGRLAPDPDPYEPSQEGVKPLRLQDLFPDQAPLGQRFRGSNHIRRPRRACRTKCG